MAYAMNCKSKTIWILGRLKGSIPFLVATIKSPSEMNKVGREVKGSSLYCFFLLNKGEPYTHKRSHVCSRFKAEKWD